MASLSFFRKKAKEGNEVSSLTTGDQFDSGNPYGLGKNEFNNRYDRLVDNARSWKRFAFSMLALLAVSVAVVLWMAQSVKVVPFIVQVDKHGYAIAVQPVEAASVDDDRIIIARLAEFVMNARTIYADPAATMTCIKRAYNSIAGRSAAQTKLDDWFQTNNPLEKENETINTQVRSVLRLSPDSNASWQIEWSEKSYSRGLFAGERFYRGVFVIEMAPPSSVNEIMLNPLGIFISDFTITEIVSSRS